MCTNYSCTCMSHHEPTPKEHLYSRPEGLQCRSFALANPMSTPLQSAGTGKRKLDVSIPKEFRKGGSHSLNFWGQRLQDHLDKSPELKTIYEQLDKEFPGKIQFKLPRVDALSGSVLKHCSEVFERLHHSENPMIFKIGFTHNPLWRWGNPMYGYNTSRDKWSCMVVVYVSDECHSASMLEAALIDKYKSISCLADIFDL